MTYLLTADIHLDDKPENEYRWEVFTELDKVDADEIMILGDLTDRADYHSSRLVNRLVPQLKRRRRRVTILRGNHDTPLNGPAYWSFLSEISGIEYIDGPMGRNHRLLLLPSTPDPAMDWQAVAWDRHICTFMHQTVFGATLRTGIYADKGMSLDIFPEGMRVYSGDLHYPHKIGCVTYVGAPHPKNFGDDHDCRFLVLDDDFRIQKSVPLSPMRKHIIDVDSVAALRDFAVNPHDQVIVRFRMDPAHAEHWPRDRDTIAQWAQQNDVNLVSSEPSAVFVRGTAAQPIAATDPKQVLEAFGISEGLDEHTMKVGMELLAEKVALG